MSAPFVHEFRVRWGECDPQGIVFNAHYVAYFDEAIVALWREAFDAPYGEMVEEEGIDMVVAEVNVQYRASARPEDLIRVELTIENLGETSMTSRLDVVRDGELLVEGRMRHVFVDTASWTKTPILDSIRAGLAPYVTPAVEPA